MVGKPIPVTADGSGPPGAIPINLYGAGGGGGGGGDLPYPNGTWAFKYVSVDPLSEGYSFRAALQRVGNIVYASLSGGFGIDFPDMPVLTLDLPDGFAPLPPPEGNYSYGHDQKTSTISIVDFTSFEFSVIGSIQVVFQSPGDPSSAALGVIAKRGVSFQAATLSWPTSPDLVTSPLTNGWASSP